MGSAAPGIHPCVVCSARQPGLLERLSRGLYRLAELPPLTTPDVVTVALKVPGAPICLISALAFHELTTQAPHAVDIAPNRGDEPPRLDWFSGPAYREGIDTPVIDGTPARIYSPEKTIADCLKLRRRVGLDVAPEALKAYRRRPGFDPAGLLRYARICRVEKVMKPYLQMVE